MWTMDITDGEWVFEDVCSRHEAREIVADGIVGIFGAFLSECWDHNMKQPRFDILIVSINGDRLQFTRIHPGSHDPGVPTIGFHPEMWGLETDFLGAGFQTLAPTQGGDRASGVNERCHTGTSCGR